MRSKKDDRSRSLIRLVTLILTGAAVVKELRMPADQRTCPRRGDPKDVPSV
jgi:hypothetical protein